MKRELKTEILTEIGKSNAPAAVGSNTLETSSESKRQIAAKRAYGDYIAHALQHGEIATGTTSGNLVQPPQSQGEKLLNSDAINNLLFSYWRCKAENQIRQRGLHLP